MFAAPSMTETVLLIEFVTYIVFVTGFTATPDGNLPTDTVVVTVFVEPSITDTAEDGNLAAYTIFVTGFTASPEG